MIRLTRINDSLVVINAEMIELLEQSPDTIVTMTTGHKIFVKESVDDVIERVMEYKRSILNNPITNRTDGKR